MNPQVENPRGALFYQNFCQFPFEPEPRHVVSPNYDQSVAVYQGFGIPRYTPENSIACKDEALPMINSNQSQKPLIENP